MRAPRRGFTFPKREGGSGPCGRARARCGIQASGGAVTSSISIHPISALATSGPGLCCADCVLKRFCRGNCAVTEEFSVLTVENRHVYSLRRAQEKGNPESILQIVSLNRF